MKKRSISLLLFSLLSLSLISCQSSYSGKTPPKAINGILDLRDWNFENDGPVNLSGEWELYWEHLLEGINSDSKTRIQANGVFEIPNRWEDHTLPDGRVLTHLGYATFKLKVLLPAASSLSPHLSHLALKTGLTDSAYSLQVFSEQGELLGNPLLSGIVGSNRKSTTPMMRYEYSIQAHAPVWIVTYKVSNFHYLFGGVELPPKVGTPEQLRLQQNILKFVDFSTVGLLWIMGIYHLILFALYPKDRSTLCFGVLCVLMSVYLILSQLHLASAFPHLHQWVFLTNLIFQCVGWISVLFMIFIRILFLKQSSLRLFYLLTGITLTSTSVLLFFPLSSSISRSAFFILLSSLFIDIFWIFYVLIRALLAREQTAQILFTGFFFLSLGIIHDVLFQFQVIKNTELIAPYGLSLFILAHAIVIALRNQSAHKEKVLAQNLAIDTLRQSDALKDEFLANTSHELRTPLHGIIGIAESLKEGATGSLSQTTQDHLSLVIQSGTRLSHLIDDILDVSKMRHQDLQLQRSAVDSRSAVNLVLSLSQPLLADKPLQLLNQMPEELPFVDADEDRLQQILMNLVGNAIKFTHKGSITVFAQQETNALRIFVKDTGIGIPEDQQEQVFQSFKQGDSSISRAYGGTGLGLTVTRQLVELHGGSLELQSIEGQGSTFSFTLPLADSNSPISHEMKQEPEALIHPLKREYAVELKPSELPSEASSSQKQGAKILLVDDENINIQVLHNQLCLYDYQILTAQDGVQALKLVEEHSPDLILLDLMMPGMNGYEVCQTLRGTHSSNTLPIVILTAKNRVKDFVEAFESGANDYLSKPFSKQELLSRIQTQLTLSEQHKAIQKHAETLEIRLQERTTELELRHAQLLISEKMAALGRLLAGVAHELNTPIGVGVTASSHLFSKTEQFIKEYQENTMTRSSLKAYTSMTQESTQLILNNLKTASTLIQNFKQVIRDQSQEQIRTFNLKSYLGNVLKQLAPELDKTDHKFCIHGIERCELRSDPGAFAQILTNFVTNSLLHGYEQGDSGTMTVEVLQTEEGIVLIYSDDGLGIASEDLPHIFESFYTTKPGSGGGTGLGLHIVYNLVTQRLGGTIDCQSELGEGVQFTIKLPSDQRSSLTDS